MASSEFSLVHGSYCSDARYPAVALISFEPLDGAKGKSSLSAQTKANLTILCPTLPSILQSLLHTVRSRPQQLLGLGTWFCEHPSCTDTVEIYSFSFY